MQTKKISQRKFSKKQILLATEKYGTPLYLYDFNIIRQQFTNLSNALPSNFHVFYTLKANSSLAICHQLSQLCKGADVSSMGELHTALKAGFSPKEMIFTGPAKDRKELSTALEIGCGLIVLESVTEAYRLNELAIAQGCIQDVLIRINPLYRTNNSCDIQTLNRDQTAENTEKLKTFICNEGASKFGVDEEQGEEAIKQILALKNLNLKGIHIFTESNVLNYRELLASWKNTIEMANMFRSKGYPISIVDFGGGIGIPYNTIDDPFDVDAFGQELYAINKNNPYEYEYILEIGRYLVGDAGVYVTDILDIKESQGQTFVLINGGKHQLCRPQFIMGMNKNMEILGKSEHPKKKVKLVGKLPTSSDVMLEEALVAKDISVGDQLIIYTCGAYGFGLSLTNFILHNSPAEAAYINGKLQLIRDRGKVSDFFVNQHIMPLSTTKKHLLIYDE